MGEPIINTIRVLVDWKCNLRCDYCCNEQERFRKDIEPVGLYDINFENYRTCCITGGEPLLFMRRVEEVAILAHSAGCMNVLYTNGIYLNAPVAQVLESWNVDAVNVGLHVPQMFDKIIREVTAATKGTSLKVRFHAQDIHESNGLALAHPGAVFRFWQMDDCERVNERRVVLSE